MKRSNRSVSLLIGLLGVTFAGLVSMSLASLRSVDALPVFDHLGKDFQLQSTSEHYNSLSSAAGKVVLISFGFTSCTDICPMMLRKYEALYKELDQKQLHDKPLSEQVVLYFVTVDPERDTLEVMQRRIEDFDSRIIGLTGDQESIDQLIQSLALMAKPIEGTDQFVHSDRIMVFDPAGRLRAMPNLQDPVSELVVQIESLLVKVPAEALR